MDEESWCRNGEARPCPKTDPATWTAPVSGGECSDEGTLSVKRKKLDSHVRSELQTGLST